MQGINIMMIFTFGRNSGIIVIKKTHTIENHWNNLQNGKYDNGPDNYNILTNIHTKRYIDFCTIVNLSTVKFYLRLCLIRKLVTVKGNTAIVYKLCDKFI